MSDARPRSQGGVIRAVKEFLGLKSGEFSLRESLEEALEEHDEDTDTPTLGKEEREMLFNVLEYGALRADDVMVPRADIDGISSDISFTDMIKKFAEAAHSRMPVYRGTLDDIQGMVHVKDALKAVADEVGTANFQISTIQRPVLYVAPSMKVIDLLAKMRARRTHMAIVVDEYGGTDGLITVEDIVEEIVGEIEDEHDTDSEPVLVPLEGGGYDADARLEIEALEEALGLDLLPEDQREDVDTIGGLVFTMAGSVPEIGETIEHESGFLFEVVDADPRRIQKLRIYPAVKEQAQADAS